jgi:hypothetical protein
MLCKVNDLNNAAMRILEAARWPMSCQGICGAFVHPVSHQGEASLSWKPIQILQFPKKTQVVVQLPETEH